MSLTIKTLCRLILPILVLAVLGSGAAQAETTVCTPVTLTQGFATIDSSGVYCLTDSLTRSRTTGSAIEIQANDVTLDLNGYVLDGSGAGAYTNATAIYANGRQNLTIKNGTVRGFQRGINLIGSNSRGHVIEDIRAEGNTLMGISVTGSGSIIRRNRVFATGPTSNSTFTTSGIYAKGLGIRVLDNLVADTHANGVANAYGIYVSTGSNGAVVHGNRVSNPNLPDSGNSFGVSVAGGGSAPSHDVAVTHNTVARMIYGILYSGNSTSGLYAYNLVSACTRAFSGGTAAGTTNQNLPQ